MAKNKKYTKSIKFRVTEEQLIMAAQKGMKPEHFRAYVENFGIGSEGKKIIKSSEWKRLRDILDKTPSLNLVGDVNSGKTYLAKQLIANDRNHVYIVLDAHDEYDELPVVTAITADIKSHCRIKLPDAPEGAIGMFRVYYNLIMNQQFPKHFILVVDEALRYKKAGITNLLAESRKFLKILAISQERLVSFVPSIFVENYNRVNI